MKKFVFAVIFLAVLSVSGLYAAGFFTTIDGGYTQASMSQVNSAIIGNDSGPGINNTQLGAGAYFGIDGMYLTKENLGFHLKFEYVSISTGQIQYNNGVPGTDFTYGDIEVDPYMVPLMVGVSYTLHTKGSPFSLTAGLYGGIAPAYLYYRQHTIDPVTTDQYYGDLEYDEMYDGLGFCSEGMLSANYWFTKNFSLGVEFGYRYANISKMTAEGDAYDNAGNFMVGSGQPLQDGNGNNVGVDFSGINVGVNLVYHFGWVAYEEY